MTDPRTLAEKLYPFKNLNEWVENQRREKAANPISVEDDPVLNPSAPLVILGQGDYETRIHG